MGQKWEEHTFKTIKKRGNVSKVFCFDFDFVFFSFLKRVLNMFKPKHFFFIQFLIKGIEN